MGVFSFFRSLIYQPFTHNPEDFKLRIVPAWFSDDYVQFEYSANGGRNWKTIYNTKRPFLGVLSYDYTWEPISYRLGNGNFTLTREKFSSYQKILDYEKEERIEYEEGMASLIRQRNLQKEEKIEALKKANE